MATIPALLWIGVYEESSNTAVLVFTSEEAAAEGSTKLSGSLSGRLYIYGPLRTNGLRPRVGEEVPVRHRLAELPAEAEATSDNRPFDPF